MYTCNGFSAQTGEFTGVTFRHNTESGLVALVGRYGIGNFEREKGTRTLVSTPVHNTIYKIQKLVKGR